MQRYKQFFKRATRTRKNLRIVTKNLRIVTPLSPKRQIFHICVKIDTLFPLCPLRTEKEKIAHKERFSWFAGGVIMLETV